MRKLNDGKKWSMQKKYVFLEQVLFLRDITIWGTEVCGYKCISPAELSTMEDTIVIIMVSHYREIKKQLEKRKIKFFYFGDLFYNVYSDFHKGLWFEKNKEKDTLKILLDFNK